MINLPDKTKRPSGFYGLNGPSRFICTVLDEMRKCNETRNYAPLLSQIEEIQILANRMESALEESDELRLGDDYRNLLKKEIAILVKRRDELRQEFSDD